MSKEQVMDYVMNSPANTNPNVLSGMLDAISGTQLPSPTESDNGKVLGVDSGEYKLVEQGGVTPSVIKLGSFNGGGGAMGSSNFYAFAGGGLLSESKTLAELVGDKTVIGVKFQLPGPSLPSSTPAIWGVAINGTGRADPSFGMSPITIIPKEVYENINSLSIYCVTNQSITKVDAFAICI